MGKKIIAGPRFLSELSDEEKKRYEDFIKKIKEKGYKESNILADYKAFYSEEGIWNDKNGKKDEENWYYAGLITIDPEKSIRITRKSNFGLNDKYTEWCKKNKENKKRCEFIRILESYYNVPYVEWHPRMWEKIMENNKEIVIDRISHEYLAAQCMSHIMASLMKLKLNTHPIVKYKNINITLNNIDGYIYYTEKNTKEIKGPIKIKTGDLLIDKVSYYTIIDENKNEKFDSEDLLMFYYFRQGKIEKTKIGKIIDKLKQGDHEVKIKAPDYALALLYYGVVYDELGMHKEAIEAFKQAIRINPDDADAHNNLGVVYHKLGMHKEAIEAYKEAIRINPDHADAHYNLGVAYFFLGMHKEAIEAFKEAIRINPDYADAHRNLGIVYGELHKHREAIEAYKEAIRINPDDATAYYNLGVNYYNLRMYREAVEAYKQAIRINPDNADAHNNLGEAYKGLGMYKEAVESFKQAIRINPDHARAHYNLGVVYILLNDRSSALEEYNILKDLAPHLANELFNLIYKK